MKRLGSLMAMALALVLLLAACTQNLMDEPTPAAPGEATEQEEMMDKEDDMTEESMDKEDDMMEEPMDKEDNMNEESMDKDDDMMEDTMEKEDHMDEDTMEKEDNMTEDAMDKEDDMMEESMDKEDDMMEDTMDKEDDMMEEESGAMMNDGNPAPAFSLMDLDGNQVSLADLEGEKVYVKYWASWCSICVAGLDEIDELSATATDFKVITIVTPNANGEKNTDNFKDWFANKDTSNITVLLDEKGVYAREFGVRAMPTSAFIGSDGVLVKVQPGHKSNEQITGEFQAIY